MQSDTARSPAYARESAQHSRGTRHRTRVTMEYVRNLQRRQGHEPCFFTEARFTCMEFDCPWRNDCMRLVAECFR